jgi:hypothetical protein
MKHFLIFVIAKYVKQVFGSTNIKGIDGGRPKKPDK